MVLLGTIVNVVTIIIGCIFGLFFSKIQERYKNTIMHGIGLTVILIGLQMAFQTNAIIIVLLSLLTGAAVGEFFKLDDLLNRFGDWISTKMSGKANNTNISQGFVTASLIFVVGAMAILGALDSGLRGDHEILYTKATLDGFTSFVLTTTLGIGVVLSIIPVLLYQGAITLFATQIEAWIPEVLFNEMITEVTAVGGLLILAIGLNMLKITNIKVTNLLPSIFTVAIILAIYHWVV